MSVLVKELLSGSHGAGHFMWTDMLRSHDQTNTDAAFKQILVFLDKLSFFYYLLQRALN